MIYYFSGTGNSLYVARHLADLLGEKLFPMALADSSSLSFAEEKEGAAIGLVFPVYAWGIPNVVERFVQKVSLSRGNCPQEAENLGRVSDGGPKGLGGTFLYAVMTCGDDMGYADKVLEKVLGRKLDAAFSVLMPDVYVCLPGFDVDSKDECREKYAKEKDAVQDIAACVRERRQVRHLKRGPFPWTKTYVIRPLFNRYLLTDKYFNVDKAKCIACGRCQKNCPVGNILIIDDVPAWQSHCAGCLACFHACPYHAINFGNQTQKKGQYNLLKMMNEA